MSHLPLDARAILEYLNELGYRNISAEQLKEFMKGMQRHSEIGSSKGKQANQQNKSAKESSNSYTQQHKLPTTKAERTCSPKQQSQQQPRTNIRIIKSKKPLIHFKFYVDICDHQLGKKIENRIKQLGGSLEFFLTPSVTHFITDKAVLPPTVGHNNNYNNNNNNNNNNNTLSSRPGTPQTPLTPYSHESLNSVDGKNNAATPTITATLTATPSGNKRTSIRQTRADAILNRARRSTIATVNSPITTKKPNNERSSNSPKVIDNNWNQQPYVLWQTEQALRFLSKVQNDLKDYLEGGTRERKGHSSKTTSSSSRAFGPTHLKGSFIKIESLKRNYRPYYQLFKKPIEWPKIDFTREDGAFRLSPKKEIDIDFETELQKKRMTRKSRSRSSQRQNDSTQVLNKNNNDDDDQKPASNNIPADECKLQQAKQETRESEKQCGVCEICKIEYDTLTIHLKTKDHEYFAKNPQNFIALDTLIQTSADVNKFLKEDDDDKTNSNMELEEMEVEEQEEIGETLHDPLEDCVLVNKAENKRVSNDAQMQSLSSSSGVRERSKRITKGKHSSEKFQNNLQRRTTSKSPKSPKPLKSPKRAMPKSISPKKKPTALTVNISSNPIGNIRNEELHDGDEIVSPGVVTRKKQTTSASVYSPPMRAMLPPSSMYKVVDGGGAITPAQRKLQGTTDQAATIAGSPSIIVKFKKVRQAEMCRLTGEADSLVYRKQRTSSELPTDLDRQTTSDHVRANNSNESSTSLESSINDSIRMELGVSDKTEGCCALAAKPPQPPPAGLNRKAIAIGKRRSVKAATKNKMKSETQKKITKSTIAAGNKQRFPSAPIQPEVQLKNNARKTAKGTINAAVAHQHIAGVPNFYECSTRRLAAVPEATRKSSRTATAIVTAATTSSRLLRAAVEAAKKANTENGSTTVRATKSQSETMKASKAETTIANAIKLNRRLSVVTMEDRMGDSGPLIDENDSIISNSQIKRNNVLKTVNMHLEDDDDDDDMFEEDEDDEDEDEDDGDEDFILNTSGRSKTSNFNSNANNADIGHAATREERAARRWNQRISSLDALDNIPEEILKIDVQYEPVKKTNNGRRKVATKVYSPRAKKSKCDAKNVEQSSVASKKVVLTSPPQRAFDISKSERIPKQTYAFERVPATDLWFRVYTRQDTCQERYFEYYGSRTYRKLPYEMGPIPFELTTLANCAQNCKICNQTAMKLNKEPMKTDDQMKIDVDDMKIKDESTKIVSEEPVCVGSSKQQLNEESIKKTMQSTLQTPYAHKHKKLHLLQRYRQEQQQEQQQKKKQEQQEQQCMLKQKQHEQEQDQEQEQEQPEVFTEPNLNLKLKCDSKASTPDREAERERERAGSTHSTTSSCCTASSSATLNSKHKYRNKHLNKAALINLELPPRKSPREHASTLALVSCLIRQRQDSMCKTNSETDEPATVGATPAKQPMSPNISSVPSPLSGEIVPVNSEERPTTPVPPPPAEIRSPRSIRSAAATPIEELRFATEISENVKRMRRGQNKYDHSPPIVLKKSRPSRGKCKTSPVANSPFDRRTFKAIGSSSEQMGIQECDEKTVKHDERRRPRSLLLTSRVGVDAIVGRKKRPLGRPPKVTKTSLPSVRKTGSKKGVLEFEMDGVALKALKASMVPQRSTHQLEWEIDKYLELAGKDYGCEDMGELLTPTEVQDTNKPSCQAPPKSKKGGSQGNPTTPAYAENTPPPTDCFSSDFDLYDLFNASNETTAAGVNQTKMNKMSNLSLYSSVALQNYFRKRKSLKSNRTGWPKAQRKKTSQRNHHHHQHGLRQKIRFLNKNEPLNNSSSTAAASGTIKQQRDKTESIHAKAEVDDEDNASSQDAEKNCRRPKSGESRNYVITPPDSEADDDDGRTTMNGEYDDEEYLESIDEAQLEINVAECVSVNEPAEDEEPIEDEDDGETVADSVEIERCGPMDMDADAAAEADIEADADEEDDDDDDEEDDDDEGAERVSKRDVVMDDETTTMFMEQRHHNRVRHSKISDASPEDFKVMGRISLNDDGTGATSSLTSTPTRAATTTGNMLRGSLRRTPVLLNGSLGSCISPSEKAGDNSDIFTVSSDGLDTDLDLSNSHLPYHRAGDDEQQQQNETKSCPHRTPKRKYDISKYAPNGKNSRTCAAEAATAAVKSLAISQFLKKEVRVTCRRLRQPFRRFRFRR